MKIKHWQGYGSLNAKKIRKGSVRNMYGQVCDKLVVLVWGNHEWGIETDDKYRLYHWLVKRFYRGAESERDILKVTSNHYYKNVDGIDVEHCEYTFIFAPKS